MPDIRAPSRPSIALRDYAPADAPALSLLYRRSVETLGPRGYSARQVAAWASLAPSAGTLDAWMADGRRRIVAEDAGVAGFVDVEPNGHVALLYVAPEAAGRGVGGRLCDAAEAAARGFAAPVLFTEASEIARPMFERRGYELIGRRDLKVAGVPIHNFAMARRLGDG